MTTPTLLSLADYDAMRRGAPAYASRVRDDLHTAAGTGDTRAADTLAALCERHPWWRRTCLAIPATAAITHATARPRLDLADYDR